MTSAANPYAVPGADLQLDAPENAIELRRLNLNHEAQIQAVGSLHYLGALLFACASISGFLMLANPHDHGAAIGMLVLGLTGSLISFYLGRGLRRLDPRVRLPLGILAGVGLLNVPVGTLINLYVLYLVFGSKGKLIFSAEYQRVIEQTPQIRYQTPMLVKALGGLLVAGLIAIVVALMR